MHRRQGNHTAGWLLANQSGAAISRSQQSPAQAEAVQSEVKRRETSYVQGQQSAKNFGTLVKSLQGALLKPGMTIERKHQSRHQHRATRKAPMRSIVTGKIA